MIKRAIRGFLDWLKGILEGLLTAVIMLWLLPHLFRGASTLLLLGFLTAVTH